MRIVLSIWTLSLFFIISCSTNNNKKKVKFVKDETGMVMDNLSEHTTFSPLDSLIKVLLHDNYELRIDTVFNKVIIFISYNIALEKNQQDTFQFHTKELVTIIAKGKLQIKNTGFFPRLTIQQMTLNSTNDANDIKNEIEKIIYNPDDIINDKLYDRVRIYDNKIYYMETHAKVFERFVIHYDNEFRKIINAR